jgi:hypothetical protein
MVDVPQLHFPSAYLLPTAPLVFAQSVETPDGAAIAAFVHAPAEKSLPEALADAFCELRCVTLLMHPAVPEGCELICEHMGFAAKDFFSWDNAFLDQVELAARLGEAPEEHAIVELPPRFDFFRKHPSQEKKRK